MSDYLRSALGYLNGSTNSNEYVGQIVEINNVKLRVNRLIAEGEWSILPLLRFTVVSNTKAVTLSYKEILFKGKISLLFK